MITSPSCPSPERLGELLADQLPDAETHLLENHVENCVECQRTLERLTAANPAWPEQSSVCFPKAKGGTAAERTSPSVDFLHRLEKEPPARRSGAAPGPFHHDPDRSKARRSSAEPSLSLTVFRIGPQQATTLQPLLRRRLLLITGIFFPLALINVLVVLGTGLEQFRLLLGLFMALVVLAGVFFVILLGKPFLPISVLRLIELVFFASLAGLYALNLRERIWEVAAIWNPSFVAQGFFVSTHGHINPSCLLIIFYGILIPNTWLRATVVVGLLTLVPLVAVFLASGVDPGRPVSWVIPVLMSLATWLGWAAGIAIFGAHRLEVLRQEAVEARRLGQYQLKKRLGGGGMGEVFLAEHLLLRRPCAIKLIRPERAGDPRNLLRFEREVQATATLTHPNTVEVLDYGRAEDGTFYYVMEYLPGLSLQELIQRHGPLPAERVVYLLRQVCGALQEAHSAGLIHRDIKPGNILICHRGGRSDVAKLLDFGLVQLPGRDPDQSRLTQEGVVAGTPDYMSPEQVADPEQVEPRSDIYSVGAVAYFLLTGQPPFVRATAAETMAAHLRDVVLPPSRLNPALPADVEQLVLACLHKDPSRRPASAQELGLALDRCSCAALWTADLAANWWSEHGNPA